MTNKVIHYCWFGKKPLPKSARKCIRSWRKYLPDYEIKEWNESNYDVNVIPYTQKAYDAGKFAFVSDYARFDILYREGGIYFDTDVELIRPIDDILDAGAFMGCEIDGGGDRNIMVAPGLGLAAEPQMDVYEKILAAYRTFEFTHDDGSLNLKTVVSYTTEVLQTLGLKNTGGIQKVAGVTVYPKDYFNPLNNNTGVLTITENTRSIHWYSKTWLTGRERMISRVTQVFHRFFGDNCFAWLKRGNK